jgi:glyoxylase-like metal-dependent hydrolase (beta-lactamase superfamily II)
MATPEVRVRMYKRILGDCFLITVRQGDEQSNLLIDCGVLQSVPGDKAMMQEVARDIVESTPDGQGKAVLHMLAVTHEHHDHISGFAHARDTFFGEDSPLTVERVWMGWTEKPGDEQADQLRQRFEKSKVAVSAAASLARLRMGANATLPELDGLDDFVGPVDGGLAAAGGGRMTGRKTMQALKDKAGEGNVDYLEPGEVITTPGPVGLRAYVLGPPRKPERLFTDLPSAEGHETYLNALNQQAEAFAMNLGATSGTVDAAGVTSPFSRRHQLLTVEAAQELAGAEPRGDSFDGMRALYAGYYHPEGEARRIDTDWAGAAGALALKLDSDTNNGSLVLAFELGDEPGKGPVLLFAADAQVGNWQSWHDQAYPETEEKNKAGVAELGKVTAESLLNRTVLYKVGHHASHNATLKGQGLEMMKDPGLVAMIPVVSAVSDTKKGWHMPYVPLLKELVVRTKGRVLRGDCALGDGLKVKKEKEEEKIVYGDPLPVDPAFEGRLEVRKGINPATQKEDEFWVEYRVS